MGWELLQHHPYNPDLTSNNFFLGGGGGGGGH
jgi:hypothetical protein